jgi:hypothetical protein
MERVRPARLQFSFFGVQLLGPYSIQGVLMLTFFASTIRASSLISGFKSRFMTTELDGKPARDVSPRRETGKPLSLGRNEVLFALRGSAPPTPSPVRSDIFSHVLDIGLGAAPEEIRHTSRCCRICSSHFVLAHSSLFVLSLL